MRLTSPRFNWNARLQMAANNSPALRKGSGGLCIRHIQQALIDLGHPLPKSTAKYSTPDGMFGGETKQAVIDFQKEQKKTLSYFSVDGVVGGQTMGAFDSQLRTPVTLPPLPSGGGWTNADANLTQSIINVLSHPGLAKVDFNAMGVKVSWGSYLMVRNALQTGDITAEKSNLGPGIQGVYLTSAVTDPKSGDVAFDANTFVMPFTLAATNERKAIVVHEATHAYCDIMMVGTHGSPFTRNQSETVAHIAQAAMHRLLDGGAQTDSMTSDPAQGLNPIYLAADVLAEKVLKGQNLPVSEIGVLHTEVNRNNHGMSFNNNTNFDGI